jgi:hypothetical protein
LRVLVVNEPGLADAINRLRGEWAECSGGTLNASSATWAEVAAMKQLDTDVIIFPARYLGELCTRDWLRPVRSSVLESQEFNAADVFPVVRQTIMKWGGETIALPLGVVMPNPSAVEQHPSIGLLNRAASKALSNEHEGVLFDSRTMKPRIISQAFVDALAAISRKKISSSSPLDNNEKVPVIGFADKLISVTANSHNAASAFKLITWLATPEFSSQIANTGDGSMPVRRSLASSSAWYKPKLPLNKREELGNLLTEALSGHDYLVVPRIPGIDEYIATLDRAVTAVVDGKMQPRPALEAAAANWERITDAHGRGKQRDAYLKHLGISGQ